MGLWVAWSGGRCLCPWQGLGWDGPFQSKPFLVTRTLGIQDDDSVILGFWFYGLTCMDWDAWCSLISSCSTTSTGLCTTDTLVSALKCCPRSKPKIGESGGSDCSWYQPMLLSGLEPLLPKMLSDVLHSNDSTSIFHVFCGEGAPNKHHLTTDIWVPGVGWAGHKAFIRQSIILVFVFQPEHWVN